MPTIVTVCVDLTDDPSCDTTDLAQAVDDLPNGGIIEVLPGEYGVTLLSTTLDATIRARTPDTVTLRGVGSDVIVVYGNVVLQDLTLASDSAESAIVMVDGGSITAVDVVFEAREVAWTTAAAIAHNGGRLDFTRTAFVGFSTTGGTDSKPLLRIDTGSTLVLTDVYASLNRTAGPGLIEASGGSVVEITGGLFQDNVSATEGTLARVSDSTIAITDAQIDGNTSSDTEASGVIALYGTSEAALTDVRASGNRSGRGGVVNAHPGTTVRIVGGRFVDNYGGEAGGVVYINGGSLEVDGAVFLANLAEGWGGAIDMDDSALAVTRSGFCENQAGIGGAIATFRGLISSTYAIDHSWFIENVGTGSAGGALYVNGDVMPIDHVALLANASDQGGGVSFNFNGSLTRSVIAWSAEGYGLYNAGPADFVDDDFWQNLPGDAVGENGAPLDVSAGNHAVDPGYANYTPGTPGDGVVVGDCSVDSVVLAANSPLRDVLGTGHPDVDGSAGDIGPLGGSGAPETDTDTDADSDTDTDSDTDADSDTDSDSDADADSDTDSDADADADTDVPIEGRWWVSGGGCSTSSGFPGGWWAAALALAWCRVPRPGRMVGRDGARGR